jgi:DNA-directed RNA polymerase subunit RPC12/RpoP
MEKKFEIIVKCNTCGETIDFNNPSGKMYIWNLEDEGLVIKCNNCGTEGKA